MDNQRKIKLVLLFVYVLAAVTLVYFLRPVYLLSILIVMLPPAVVNFLWLKKSRFKIWLFALASTLLFAPPIELAARLANAWDVQSVLPRLFGLAPLENLIFAFLNFFWTLSFYEYFIDRDDSAKISPRFKRLIFLYCVIFILFFILFFKNQALVTINYHTLSLIILFIPGVFIFGHRPKLLLKTWLPTLFFALVFFVYEIVSLVIGSWWWPGEYLSPVTLFGQTFPLDDVIIWYFLSTPVLIGGYEFFMDDEK